LTQIHEKERQLHREVADKVESALPGVEVLAVELAGPARMCVYLDRAGRAVDHALCAEVTDLLRSYLNEYSLEVSSPGLERPVRTRPHFERAVGRRVAIRTAREIAGRKRIRGEVVRVGEGTVTLAADDEIEVPYDEIVRGNLIDGERER
jgi:ribosome maturation factor RimP